MATYSTPIPGGDIYGWRKLDAEKAYQSALAQLSQRRTGILQQYGYAADFDPETGQAGNIRIDPNSQYGAVQQMLRGQAQQYDAAEAESQARGLGGVGLGAQASTEARYQGGRQTAALGSGLLGDLGSLSQAQLAAKQARDAAQWEAEWEASRAAIEDQAFTPADVSDLSYNYDEQDAPIEAPGKTPAQKASDQAKQRAAAAARALRLRSEAMNQRYGLGITNQRQMEIAAAKKPLPKPPAKPAKKKGK